MLEVLYAILTRGNTQLGVLKKIGGNYLILWFFTGNEQKYYCKPSIKFLTGLPGGKKSENFKFKLNSSDLFEKLDYLKSISIYDFS